MTDSTKTLRQTLGLTTEEFATRFRIPLDMLMAWEEGTAEPDPVASTYLRAIAGDVDAMYRALQAGLHQLD
jgi:DNA-binding transcriptional regulator YiaG